jgi:hypothetical protein
MYFAFLGDSRYYGDTGGEMTHHAPQLVTVDRHQITPAADAIKRRKLASNREGQRI